LLRRHSRRSLRTLGCDAPRNDGFGNPARKRITPYPAEILVVNAQAARTGGELVRGAAFFGAARTVTDPVARILARAAALIQAKG
jgi:hypothetical protein